MDNLSLPVGFSVERLEQRRELFDQIHAQQDAWIASAEKDPFANQQKLAYSLLLSGLRLPRI